MAKQAAERWERRSGTYTVVLRHSVAELLDEMANRTGKSRSQLIREIVDDFIGKSREAIGPTGYKDDRMPVRPRSRAGKATYAEAPATGTGA